MSEFCASKPIIEILVGYPIPNLKKHSTSFIDSKSKVTFTAGSRPGHYLVNDRDWRTTSYFRKRVEAALLGMDPNNVSPPPMVAVDLPRRHFATERHYRLYVRGIAKDLEGLVEEAKDAFAKSGALPGSVAFCFTCGGGGLCKDEGDYKRWTRKCTECEDWY